MATGSETAAPHPFFVYGTLRKGGANSHLWGRHGEGFQPAVLTQAALWDLGPYPMVIPGDGAIWGELVWVAPAKYAQILAALDRLEGVDAGDPASEHGLYRRLLCPVWGPAPTGTGASRGWWPEGAQEVMAWVYWGRPHTARRGYPVQSGDWMDRRCAPPQLRPGILDPPQN